MEDRFDALGRTRSRAEGAFRSIARANAPRVRFPKTHRAVKGRNPVTR